MALRNATDHRRGTPDRDNAGTTGPRPAETTSGQSSHQEPHQPRGALARIAGWSIAHPWQAIALWVVLVVAAIGGSAASGGMHTMSQEDYRLGDSGVAEQLMQDSGLMPPASELVHVTGGGGADGAAGQAAAEAKTVLEGTQGVQSVEGPVWSPVDGSGLLTVALTGDESTVDIAQIHQTLDRVETAHPGVALGSVGDASIAADVQARVTDDFATAESRSLPITIVVLLVVFGAFIAAGLPVVVALTSIGAAIGLAGPISLLIPMDPSAMQIILLIGMAVGVDYSLFYLKREREERARGASHVDAVRIAAQTSGHSIVVSGVAVAVSMAGLLAVGMGTFTSLFVAAVSVVVLAVVGSLVFLPAMLTVLGRFVDRPKVPFLWRLTRPRPERPAQAALAARLARPVVRRPRLALAASMVVVAVLSAPALALKVNNASLDTLPGDLPAVQQAHQVAASFPGEGTDAAVVVEAPAGEAERVRGDLQALAQQSAGSTWSVAGEPQTSADGTVSVLRLATTEPATSGAFADQVRQLRERASDTFTEHAGTRVVVGGEAGFIVDADHRMGSRLPWAVLGVLVLTAVMMFAAFRSWTLAGISTVLNLASVGVAFGVLVAIFQTATGADLVGAPDTGRVVAWVPLFLFVVLMGLSMDYHVFVLSRIRELLRSGASVPDAVLGGVGRTAGVVTSAAVVMVSVFAMFATLSMVEMKQLGIGLAVAVAVDATLVRLVMLPAALALAGRRAWSARDRGVQEFSVKERAAMA